MKIVDAKPKNFSVEDVLPNNEMVSDAKPKMIGPDAGLVDQLYDQVITAGMYMGIPPFTYPEAGTVSSPFSP